MGDAQNQQLGETEQFNNSGRGPQFERGPDGWMHLVDGPPEQPDYGLSDTVKHPDHYNFGGIECVDAIGAQLSTEEYRGYLRGNIVKYMWRYRHKDGIEGLMKAREYLRMLIEFEEDLT